jgi:hypothetical protein
MYSLDFHGRKPTCRFARECPPVLRRPNAESTYHCHTLQYLLFIYYYRKILNIFCSILEFLLNTDGHDRVRSKVINWFTRILYKYNSRWVHTKQSCPIRLQSLCNDAGHCCAVSRAVA